MARIKSIGIELLTSGFPEMFVLGSNFQGEMPPTADALALDGFALIHKHLMKACLIGDQEPQRLARQCA